MRGDAELDYEYILSLLEQKAEVGVWAWDLRTQEFDWSTGMYGLFGLVPSTTRPRIEDLRQVIHPADWAQVFAPRSAERVGEIFDKKIRLQRPGAPLRWVRIVGRFAFGDNGEPLSALGFAIDDTAAVVGRDELSYLRAVLQAAQNIIPMHIWSAAADGSLAPETPTWIQLGQAKSFALGEVLERIHPSVRKTLEEKWSQAVRDQQPCTASFPVQRENGGWHIVTASAVPLWLGDHRQFSWVGLYTTAAIGPKVGPQPFESGHISGAQIRAARALLGWTLTDLSSRANIGFSTAQRLEDKGVETAHARTLAAVRKVLESAGIRFVSTGEGHNGVVLAEQDTQSDEAGSLATA